MTNLCGVTSAPAAGNHFLLLGKQENEPFPPIDQMKLQKLLFYAHAWHLALNDQPLFDEDFEAWPWGPVVRDVYLQTRKFGSSAVNEPLKRLSADGYIAPPEPDGDTREFLRRVWTTHRQFSGVQLSNSTHAEGEPWTIVKEMIGLRGKPTIPNDLIQEVFRKKLDVGTDQAAG